MHKVTLLKRWILPGTRPSVYDTESGTALEMVARLHGEMETLQKTYNEFVDDVNKTITEFINDTEADMECFKAHIDEVMHNYIEMIDEKIKLQDSVIDNAVKYMKDNLSETAVNIITEMSKTGEIVGTLNTNYDEETESLTIDTITFSFNGGEE